MPYPLGHRAIVGKFAKIWGSHWIIKNLTPILLTGSCRFQFDPPNKKAPARFELAISCLLDRRFNQLSHGAGVVGKPKNNLLFKLDTQISSIFSLGAVSVVVITSALHAEGRQFEPGTAQFWIGPKWSNSFVYWQMSNSGCLRSAVGSASVS